MNAAYFAGMPTAQRRRAARRYLAFATPPTRRLGRRGARRAAPVYPADGLRLRAGGAATWGNRLRPHALTLLITRQLLHELHRLESDIEYFVVPPLCPLLGSPYDFSQTNKLIERAAESTRTWLTEGGLRRREVPQQLRTHKHY